MLLIDNTCNGVCLFGLFFGLNFETIELYNMEIMKLLFEWLIMGKLSIIFDFFKEKNYK